ncbi:hypothetical protein J2T02_002567 [Chitinophaga terrae (ex Kim and Jung 2007)]|uniref:plasmid mobilization protein n=1 Tax=Chitinophaga terrae (ex Kim and Jung 2007) TaxID=408074 RepID=UPI00278653D9|nr:mobilization protein [Chitinophaga terrae (ex Kim and Jung 2007)]MDQ0107448.1 hypothetical protein [Chitinophaga terrae (ex Kim and Jung 2007)]
MKKQKLRSRFLPCRISDEELAVMKVRYKQTNCSNFSEFIRRVLIQDKIIAYYRNQSMDELMEELIMLRKELNAIGRNINQAVRRLQGSSTDKELRFWLQQNQDCQTQHLEMMANIQARINQFAVKWLQE